MSDSDKSKKFDPYKTFHISAEERKVIDQRAQARTALKKQWQKLVTDPRHQFIIDPNIQRMFAWKMRYYKLMSKSYNQCFIGFFTFFLPAFALVTSLEYNNKKTNEAINSGKVTWKERARLPTFV